MLTANWLAKSCSQAAGLVAVAVPMVNALPAKVVALENHRNS